MRILAIADEEQMSLWDNYVPGRLKEYDLIISCGDLHATYLSFLVTMGRAPVLYVHGNHDIGYDINPPEGCDCIDGKVVIYKGLRILGLGGCLRYHPGAHQYSDAEMRRRIRKLKRRIQAVGGVDIVVTHAPPKGVGDAEDPAHQGFESLLELIDSYHPQYLLHGHIHLRYDRDIQREREYNGTKVINACQSYVLDISDPVEEQESWIDRIFRKKVEKIY